MYFFLACRSFTGSFPQVPLAKRLENLRKYTCKYDNSMHYPYVYASLKRLEVIEGLAAGSAACEVCFVEILFKFGRDILIICSFIIYSNAILLDEGFRINL